MAFTDIVVLLPGIMGSTLSQHGRPVWAPTGRAAFDAVRTFGGSIKAMTLPEGIGDEAPEDEGPGGGVRPMGLFPDLHVIPGLWTAQVGYGKLESWLESFLGLTRVAPNVTGNYLPFPYDWRLSIRYNGRRLARELGPVVERWRAQGGPYADAKVVFIGHSMGGLVARWAIGREGLAPDTRRLITLATPHRGSMMAVDRLVNGVRIGWGPIRLVDLTEFARSLPGLHHLLPEYACLLADGTLHKTGELDLPQLSTTRVADAMAFYAELDRGGRSADYDFYPLVGAKQQTATTGQIKGSLVQLDHQIGGRDEQGDGTVPRLSATPSWLRTSDPIIHYATDKHGGVQSNQHVLDTLEAILTATDIVHRGPEAAELTHLDVRVPEVVPVGSPIEVLAVVTDGPARPASAVLLRDDRTVVARAPLGPAADGLRGHFPGQPEGLYAIHVEPAPGAAGQLTPVTVPFAVCAEDSAGWADRSG